jgi:hypothetical protein
VTSTDAATVNTINARSDTERYFLNSKFSSAIKSLKTGCDSRGDFTFDSCTGLGPLDDLIPESKEVDLDEIKDSMYYKVKKYADAIYKGLIVKRKREGKGMMKYRNGRVYEGDWKNDMRDG